MIKINKKTRKKVRNMEKVNELIDVLAEYIIKRINDSEKIISYDIEEKTKALAELISARASCDRLLK